MLGGRAPKPSIPAAAQDGERRVSAVGRSEATPSAAG